MQKERWYCVVEPGAPDLFPAPHSPTTVVKLSGHLDQVDVPQLSACVCSALAEAGSGPIVCDIGTLTTSDAVALDALGRLQLAAIRGGRRIYLRGVGHKLQELLELAGLTGVLPVEGSGVESRGQPEERE
jgi:anti-anti-sigma factor